MVLISHIRSIISTEIDRMKGFGVHDGFRCTEFKTGVRCTGDDVRHILLENYSSYHIYFSSSA